MDWENLWIQFKKHRLGMLALGVIALFCLAGIYAPFLASSKPFFVQYDGTWYFQGPYFDFTNYGIGSQGAFHFLGDTVAYAYIAWYNFPDIARGQSWITWAGQ